MEDTPKREKLLSERSKQELYYSYSPALALAANFALFPKNAAHNATSALMMCYFALYAYLDKNSRKITKKD